MLSKRNSLRLLFVLFVALSLAHEVEASSEYTLRTAAKDHDTDQFINSIVSYSGQSKEGKPWADFTVPANIEIGVTHSNSSYYSDTDTYFFDSALSTVCANAETSCQIKNGDYVTECTNSSTATTKKLRCSAIKGNAVFHFTYYPNNNGVLTLNKLVPTTYAPPVIQSLGASAMEGFSPLAITFDPIITLHEGSSITSYLWEFGDGATSTEQAPSHTYTEGRTYTAKLTVFENHGLVASNTSTITVKSPGSYFVLRAAAQNYTSKEFIDSTVTVDGQTVDKTVEGKPWADVLISSNEEMLVTYANPAFYTDADLYFFDSGLYAACSNAETSCQIKNGEYTTECTNSSTATTKKLRCSATKDTAGASATFYFTYYPETHGVLVVNLLVTAGSRAPTINNMNYAGISSTAPPLNIHLKPEVITYDGSSVASYLWEFGDGATSSEAEGVHTYTSAGSYTLKFTVFDTNGMVSSKQIPITVESGSSASSNSPPQINSYHPVDSTVSVYVGESREFNITASDPNGNPLTYSWKLDNGEKGTRTSFTYTPAEQEVGTHTFEVAVSDGRVTTTHSWTVVVLQQDAQNQAPAITAYSPNETTLSMVVGENETFLVTATDPEGDALTYSWLLNNAVVSEERSFVYVARTGDVGNNVMKVIVSDGHTAVTQEWNLTVTQSQVNTAPVITDQYPNETTFSMTVGESKQFNITAVDPEGATLTYNWTVDGIPKSNETNFTYTPTSDEIGNRTIGVTVTDGSLNATQSWTVTVNAAQSPPPSDGGSGGNNPSSGGGGSGGGRSSGGKPAVVTVPEKKDEPKKTTVKTTTKTSDPLLSLIDFNVPETRVNEPALITAKVRSTKEGDAVAALIIGDHFEETQEIMLNGETEIDFIYTPKEAGNYSVLLTVTAHGESLTREATVVVASNAGLETPTGFAFTKIARPAVALGFLLLGALAFWKRKELQAFMQRIPEESVSEPAEESKLN